MIHIFTFTIQIAIDFGGRNHPFLENRLFEASERRCRAKFNANDKLASPKTTASAVGSMISRPWFRHEISRRINSISVQYVPKGTHFVPFHGPVCHMQSSIGFLKLVKYPCSGACTVEAPNSLAHNAEFGLELRSLNKVFILKSYFLRDLGDSKLEICNQIDIYISSIYIV